MDDALLMCGLQGLGDLCCDGERLVNGNSALHDTVGECWALDQLHHKGRRSRGALDSVDRRDVGMIQRSERFRLTVESGQTFGIPCHGFRQHLDGHLTREVGVRRSIHFAHSALADQGGDLVGAEAGAKRQSHGKWQGL